MDCALPALYRDEEVALRLRAVYESCGYRLYRMGSFEEYDFYRNHKPFLMGDDIITFTAADGRLMALKPDVTLSIVKSTPSGAERALYYNESVFRKSRQSGEYREIAQMGLERIGAITPKTETEVLCLAAKSLAAAGDCTLDCSHMELVEAVLAPFAGTAQREEALLALRGKSPHAMRAAAAAAGLPEDAGERLAGFAALAGPFAAAYAQAQALAAGMEGAAKPLAELWALYEGLQAAGCDAGLRLDFSILNDVDYYNGVIFQGYVKGVPRPVLSGGRYDNLLRRFDKPQGAIGFALYLDELARAESATTECDTQPAPADDYLNIALPKGRLAEEAYRLFEAAGLGCPEVLSESRRLVFTDDANRVRYFMVKPGDVDIYVEHGAADLGVVGRDVLLESGADVLELLDLHTGRCRLAVAGMAGFEENLAKPLRVATKYPAVARQYYAGMSRSVEIINLHGSIELAPLLGLADVIVDVVQSGRTLEENNLAVLADIAPSSARLIANRAAWRFKGEAMEALVAKLAVLIEAENEA